MFQNVSIHVKTLEDTSNITSGQVHSISFFHKLKETQKHEASLKKQKQKQKDDKKNINKTKDSSTIT